MRDQIKVDFRLNPRLVEVHKLNPDQPESRSPFALQHRGKFADTHFGGHHDVWVKVSHEPEERLRAAPVKPTGTGGPRLVLDALNPAPEARPILEWNLIGAVVGAEPARTTLQGVLNFDCQSRADFEQRLAQGV